VISSSVFIVDVLVHVFVQHRQRIMILRIDGATVNFGVWDAAKFVVLDPKVGLD
jgi:hypothetical protein